MNSLTEFYQLAKTNPKEAGRFFASGDFYMFLLTQEFPFMDVYEVLHKDPIRERAMENFLVLAGLKSKTQISITQKYLPFVTATDEKIMSSISYTKNDEGYADDSVQTKNNAPWLTFRPKQAGEIPFIINPGFMDSTYATENITIGTNPANSVEISLRRTTGLSVKTDRDAYIFGSIGAISITNYTGKNVKVEAKCQTGCIHFSARSYIIGREEQIPFRVTLSPLLSAQMFFRKRPYIETVLRIKASLPGQVYKKNIPLCVGEW